MRPGPPSYLFVDADTGRIFLIGHDHASRYSGFGLWFHDVDDYEIATTLMKLSGPNQWLHEYYRIDGDFMQWSNYIADIPHQKVSEDEVPEECMVAYKKVISSYEALERPAYDPRHVRAESELST